MMVEMLQYNFSVEELRNLFDLNGLELSSDYMEIMDNLKNGYVVATENLRRFFTLILREYFWCQLVSPEHELMIEFGYDFYIYVICSDINIEKIQHTGKSKIYIEEMMIG